MFEEPSIIIWILLGIIMLGLIVISISTMIHQAKRKRWVWFVLTILGVPFILLIYWSVWSTSPKFRRKKRRK